MESDYFTTQEQVTTQRQSHSYEDTQNVRQVEHLGVIVFTYLFKTWAFFFYIFAGWISSNIIVMFVIIIVLLSCDFWIVKNVSGRKLVRLRWWNTIDENGVSHWYFESRDDTASVNSVDWLAFWLQL
uniref:Golgi apparatus membrane protein TVP23 homolog n=1 Tax=Lygus hesperus TaxID=30085 RepID=A0A0A9WK65_LYGHE